MAWTLQRRPREDLLPQESVGPILKAISDANERAHAMLAAERLAEAVPALVGEAARRRYRHLYAASPVGFCLVGAMISKDARLGLYREGECVRVLLVEAAVAMRSELDVMAARLRAIGAVEVDAVIASEMQSDASLALAS
jgi:hypothetical protein